MRNMTHCAVSVKPSCHKYKANVLNATKQNINGSSYVYTIVPEAPSQPQGNMVMILCGNLAFFLECFSGGGGIYCYANFFCYVIVLGQNFRERQMFFWEGKLPQGLPPAPLWKKARTEHQ